VPVVGGREACPCGSGRRYKACHGRAASRATAFVARPFEGLAGECDWIALREFVPSATADLTLTGKHKGRTVTLATVLPAAAPAIIRADGTILVGLNSQVDATDPSRGIAAAILAGLDGDPGEAVELDDLGPDGPRLQDLLDPESPLDVTVHDSFEFWLAGLDEQPAELAALLEQANAAVYPTQRLSAAPAAYWCAMGEQRYLRWVLPHPENPLLDALARLHAAGHSELGAGTRLLGTFRASGLLVPVWDLPVDRTADQLEDPLAEIDKRLTEALVIDAPLTSAERRARDGLRTRQLTIR
jgi:hypothetical protein